MGIDTDARTRTYMRFPYGQRTASNAVEYCEKPFLVFVPEHFQKLSKIYFSSRVLSSGWLLRHWKWILINLKSKFFACFVWHFPLMTYSLKFLISNVEHDVITSKVPRGKRISSDFSKSRENTFHPWGILSRIFIFNEFIMNFLFLWTQTGKVNGCSGVSYTRTRQKEKFRNCWFWFLTLFFCGLFDYVFPQTTRTC